MKLAMHGDEKHLIMKNKTLEWSFENEESLMTRLVALGTAASAG